MELLVLGPVLARWIAIALVHSLWIGPLLAACVACIFSARRQLRVSMRYWLLVGALAAIAVAAPTAAWLHVRLAIACRPVARVDDVQAFRVVTSADTPQNGLRPAQSVTRDVSLPHVRPEPVAEWRTELSSVATRIGTTWPWIVDMWACGVLFMLGRLATGALRLRALVTRSRLARCEIQERATKLAYRLGLRRTVTVRIGEALPEPFLTGLARPTVILPAPLAASLDARSLDAVLAHELAHARHGDLWINLVQRIVESIYFFHPSVRWLSRAVQHHRELRADAETVRVTGDALSLARAIESVAVASVRRGPALAWGAGLGGDRSILVSRVEELFGMKPKNPFCARWATLAVLPAAFLGALVAASMGMAQEAAPVRAEAPVRQPTRDPIVEQVEFDFGKSAMSDGSFEVTAENAPYSEKQFSFELRFLDVDASDFRDEIAEDLTLIEESYDVTAWLVDDNQAREIFHRLYRDPAAGSIQAPKVTCSENAAATVSNTMKYRYVAKLEKLIEEKAAAFKPTIEAIDKGTTVQMKAATTENSKIDLHIDLNDCDVVDELKLHRTVQLENHTIRSQYQIPTVRKTHFSRTTTMEEGKSILISLGLIERPKRLTSESKVALAVLDFVGIKDVERESTVRERLVMVTPRRIILEREEAVIAPAP